MIKKGINMAYNKLTWGEMCNLFLPKYKDSKHCYVEGEKQKKINLKLICCVDTDWGNINSVTGYHFFGYHGFFFEDENKNFYQTNSAGFYEYSYKNEITEGMKFSFIANVTKNLELGYLKECKCTRLMHIKSKDVEILSYPERVTPEQKEKDTKESKRIERGPNGNKVKDHFQDECQICKAQGKTLESSFVKENGRKYSEAHHVVPLSKNGSDETDNIMCLCANHHRQMHYGNVKANLNPYSFRVTLDGNLLPEIPRWRLE
jgi:5-methylcytosine-specific restriction endonuclease McrA|tara:strand:+ start:984 stop:1766 length:783 start_codon:yes stop_codon:yes gene_type:complete